MERWLQTLCRDGLFDGGLSAPDILAAVAIMLTAGNDLRRHRTSQSADRAGYSIAAAPVGPYGLTAMAIISTTLCYPSAGNPTQGIFVWRRLREIARLLPLRVVAPVPWFPGIRPADTRLLEPAPREPAVVYPRMFYLPGVLKRMDAAFFARALRRGLNTLGSHPSLIDAHFEWPDGVGAYRVAHELDVPFVCTLRGKLASQIEHSARRRMIREMLLGASAVISVSRSLAQFADDVAGRELGVHVIPNGIDGEVFRNQGDMRPARNTLEWAQDAKYIVSVGHLQALKGFHHLLEMMLGIRKRLGDVRLVLVGGPAGEPEYENRIRTTIASLGLSGFVQVTGRVEPSQVATMLNGANLFALVSRSEGWCNAIAESLACGCPVVATEVGGNREIVASEELGRLVPYGRWDEFEEIVCTCLQRAWDRRRISQIGGARSWTQVGAECAELLGRLAGEQ